MQNARKEELNKFKQRELAKMATKLGIKGAHDMRKAEIVDAILGAEAVEKTTDENNKSAKDEVKTDNHDAPINVESEDKVEKGSDSIDMEQKMPYIESAQVGTIIAFRMANGKVKSAKIVHRSTKNRQFKVETGYGAQYIVKFDDVVWVRTGKRWPKGVYELFTKGQVVEDGK